MKLLILPGVFLLCYLPVKASSTVEDSTAKQKLIGRVADYISKKCDLNETQRNKLADYIVAFVAGQKRCVDNKGNCKQLKADFKTTVKRDFGVNAYKEYHLILIRIARLIRNRYGRFP